MRLKLSAAIALASLAVAKPVLSQSVAQPAPAQLSYADLADLAVAAPVVAHLRIRGAETLHADLAPNLAPGFHRFLVEAEVVALIRGEGGLAPQITYLVDLADDSRGHAARLRRHDEVLVLASRVPDRPAELRLAAPDGRLHIVEAKSLLGPTEADRLRLGLGEILDYRHRFGSDETNAQRPQAYLLVEHVDDHAWHLDHHRVQRAGLDDPPDLGDDDPA